MTRSALAAFVVLKRGIRRVSRYRGPPASTTSPRVKQDTYLLVNPTLILTFVPDIVVRADNFVMYVNVTRYGLLCYLVGPFKLVGLRPVLYRGKQARVSTVRPRLIQVTGFVPVATRVDAQVITRLLSRCVRHLLMFHVTHNAMSVGRRLT